MKRELCRIGIVGLGTMGRGLTQLFAQNGMSVAAVDLKESQLALAKSEIANSFNQAVEKGAVSLDASKAALQRIQCSCELDDLKNCTLVIEAIFEDAEVKRQLFQKLLSHCSPTTLFATNTSSFRLEELGSTEVQKRLLGMHYFFPPAANRLIEVIYPEDMAPEQKYFIDCINQATGRVVIESADECGFVVNRFFVPWLHEAARLLAAKVASLAAINQISKKCFTSPIGAFEIMNWTGLAPVIHAMETFADRFGKLYAPAPLLTQQLKIGKWTITPEAESVSEEEEENIIARLTGAVFLSVQELLSEKVATATDIKIGARVGLRWQNDPISEWLILGKREVDGRVHAFVKSMGARPSTKKANITQLIKKVRSLQVSKVEDSAVITLARPDNMNALSPNLLLELKSVWQELSRQPGIARLIIRGMGKCFSAGGDLHFLRASIAQGNYHEIDNYFALAQQLFFEIDQCAKPVVAIIEGLAMGAGVQLALAADHIIATPQASLAFPETGLGLVPGLGGTQRLSHRIGRELAKYFIFTGELVTGPIGYECQLIDYIYTDLDWHAQVLNAIEQKGQRQKPTLPSSLARLSTLMNNKNTARLVNERSLQSLPTELQTLSQKLKTKDVYALKVANQLIDLADDPHHPRKGLQEELEALRELTRRPEILQRLR